MKKGFLLSTVLVLMLLVPVFCASLSNDFSFLQEIPEYVLFMDASRNQGDAALAETMRTSLADKGRNEIEQAVISVRSSTVLARIYVERDNPDKKRAEQLLDEARAQMKWFPKNSFFSYILEAEIDSIHFLINRNLAKGISSNNNINKAIKQYPDQVQALLLRADSLLYAPAIAGGDVDKAFSMYLRLLDAPKTLLAPWELASLYSSVGVVAMKRSEWTTAYGYFKAAKTLYAFDPSLDAFMSEVEEHL